MKTALVLRVVNALLALINAARGFGVDIANLVERQERARAEGRDLTDAELQEVADKAQQAIDNIPSE